jgi:hypothetical protein
VATGPTRTHTPTAHTALITELGLRQTLDGVTDLPGCEHAGYRMQLAAKREALRHFSPREWRRHAASQLTATVMWALHPGKPGSKTWLATSWSSTCVHSLFYLFPDLLIDSCRQHRQLDESREHDASAVASTRNAMTPFIPLSHIMHHRTIIVACCYLTNWGTAVPHERGKGPACLLALCYLPHRHHHLTASTGISS